MMITSYILLYRKPRKNQAQPSFRAHILSSGSDVFDFNMMMIVDMNASKKPFGEVSENLKVLGEEIGVKIKCQHEDIFNKMHRI